MIAVDRCEAVAPGTLNSAAVRALISDLGAQPPNDAAARSSENAAARSPKDGRTAGA